MNLLDLPNEIILTICEYLNDKGKLNLTNTCKKLSQFKELLYYDTEVNIRKIAELPYKYNFTNI